MSSSLEITEQYRELAHKLSDAISAGDDNEIQRLLDELAGMRENQMFREVGRMARNLHEALNAFQLDERIQTLVEAEIPDARSRLDHVISMTDHAAHRTLTAVEASMPLSSAVGDRAKALNESWQRFTSRQMGAEDFRALSRQIGEFLPLAAEHAAAINHQLSEVVMAQDFQDLTGQIIRRVINLVEEVEENLVNLVRLMGSRRAADTEADSANHLEGPVVPGVKIPDAVSNQDEVDELLSSLGF